jgi:hypothetical protein
MVGDAYTMAKAKVQKESEDALWAPSCIDCYSAASREETVARIGDLVAAYLREAEARSQARKSGTLPPVSESDARKLLHKSKTTYYGSKGKSRVSSLFLERPPT